MLRRPIETARIIGMWLVAGASFRITFVYRDLSGFHGRWVRELFSIVIPLRETMKVDLQSGASVEPACS